VQTSKGMRKEPDQAFGRFKRGTINALFRVGAEMRCSNNSEQENRVFSFSLWRQVWRVENLQTP